MLISALQHQWLRGFIFPCWAFDRPALDTFLLSSHFLLHRLFSFPPPIPAPFTPLQLCTSRRVDDVNLVTPVNPVTPITPFIPSPPSPHHHPLHHPSWRWWPTSRRGRTEVDLGQQDGTCFFLLFFTFPLYCSFLWLLFLDSIPLNLSWAPYWSLDWRYKWNSSAAFSNLMQFSHPFTFWRAGCRIFIAFPIEIKERGRELGKWQISKWGQLSLQKMWRASDCDMVGFVQELIKTFSRRNIPLK